MMLRMTRPITSSRFLLVEDRRDAVKASSAPALRRYRLARLQLEDRPRETGGRFDYLKRPHD